MCGLFDGLQRVSAVAHAPRTKVPFSAVVVALTSNSQTSFPLHRSIPTRLGCCFVSLLTYPIYKMAETNRDMAGESLRHSTALLALAERAS